MLAICMLASLSAWQSRPFVRAVLHAKGADAVNQLTDAREDCSLAVGLWQLDSGERLPNADHEGIVFRALAVCRCRKKQLMRCRRHRQWERQRPGLIQHDAEILDEDIHRRERRVVPR